MMTHLSVHEQNIQKLNRSYETYSLSSGGLCDLTIIHKNIV